ncbi:DUF2798 domain-containing protein [Corynebacterium sp. S7]
MGLILGGGFSMEWLRSWPVSIIVAWPIAFIITMFAWPTSTKLAGVVLGSHGGSRTKEEQAPAAAN